MLREQIVEEVQKILHGPMFGNGEELEKNPLDFYSVGVLFPQLTKSDLFADDTPDVVMEEDNIDDGNIDSDIGAEGTTINVLEDTAKKSRASKEAEEPTENDELELTTKFRPSAAGISVLTRKDIVFNLHVSFGIYKKKQIEKVTSKDKEGHTKKRQVFKHEYYEKTFTNLSTPFSIKEVTSRTKGNVTTIELNETAFLTIIIRPYSKDPNLEIKTFTLINNKNATNFPKQKKSDDCIFQPSITITSEQGFSPFTDKTDLNLLSQEDLNLKLLYRDYKNFALGHGISVNWEVANNICNKVYTEVLPKEKVNGVNLNPQIFSDKKVLFIKRLSGLAIQNNYDWKEIKIELKEFVSLYQEWINNEKRKVDENAENLPAELILQAVENLKHCVKLCSRMNEGIDILDADLNSRKAFEDANRAMFMQRVMADFSKHRRKENRVQNNTDAFDDQLPDYSKIPFDSESGVIWNAGKLAIDLGNYKKGNLARWRPFQLAFLLSEVKGITDPKSTDRDTVDLIWFPTGGGKTEAYLGLTAFTIFYRRLTAKRTTGNPDNGAGVTVLMRYTLRLLNKQQFERASILICACDLIRSKEKDSYGVARISNGIWMGRSMTPNSEADQVRDYASYIQRINNNQTADTFKNSPPILSCPCCGNRLIREIVNNSVFGRWGYFRALNGMNNPVGAYKMACTNTNCDYYTSATRFNRDREKTLPIFEVDETIYNERPSLLFSTVDKFVQLAWKSEAFSLFNIEFQGGQINRLFPAPDLIIQDELHLISSALGTTYGVYEIVIDKLCKEAGGKISKIVGATATVRNAAEQCRRLYGRKGFLQFPPPALNADDSFYAQKIKGEDPKDRLYVGFMASGVTTSTALIRLASVLLERIPTLKDSNEEVDKYYTLVVYFNALKELGKFRTFLTDDIVAYRKLLANHFKTFIKQFNNNALCELSSVMTSDDITTGLDRLEKITLPILDTNNKIVKALFEKGIRTAKELKTARGSVWNEAFINEAFFNLIGLTFTNDFDADIKTFRKEADKLFQDQSQPIHVAPATNMISVGVDIPRLNTMIVNGQPKTAAEYIQASSRVGREDKGVVFTFLSPTKNRDRSHYEQFKAFHQAYYYFVESSSVTPFSGPALEKVLPTVFIALTRSLFLNGSSGVFAADDKQFIKFIDEIIKQIIERVTIINPANSKDDILKILISIKDDFIHRMTILSNGRRLAKYSDFMTWDPLQGRPVTSISGHLAVYNAPAQFTETILQDHIPTMQTLRNVESSTDVIIKSF